MVSEDTAGINMGMFIPEGAISVTVENVRKIQQRNPRFTVYRIEEGECAGCYLVARSASQIACFTRKRLRELCMSGELDTDEDIMTVMGDVFGEVVLTKPQREVMQSGPLAQPRFRDRLRNLVSA